MAYAVISITTANKEEAVRIASSLLASKLCACAQMFPVESYYHWKGRVENSEEILLLVKTKKEKYDEVEKEVLRLHSYEIPEILCSDVACGFSKYLNWIDEEAG